MILIDYSQIFIAAAMASLSDKREKINISVDLVRHMVLNSLRAYNQRFSKEYGEMVIACDSRHSWRKDFFPFYKENRKKNRSESTIDWDLLFNCLNQVAMEVKEYFPYRVVLVAGAEGDDIIAHCAMFDLSETKKVIVSGDKDFRQLQSFKGVKQFSPIEKKYLIEKDPAMFLKLHILQGDTGDGVPNVLSDDDAIINENKRQTTMSSKRLNALIGTSQFELIKMEKWQRNNALINLSIVHPLALPIHEQISNELKTQANKDRRKIYGYLIANKLSRLLGAINEF